MKRLFLISILVAIASVAFCQMLPKGVVIGLHESEIILQPDVTYNQYKEFLLKEAIPKFEEAYNGDAKIYLIEGIKGENVNNFGWIFLFKSKEILDKWIGPEGGIGEQFIDEFNEKIADVMKEQEKYVKVFESNFTDWVVQ